MFIRERERVLPFLIFKNCNGNGKMRIIILLHRLTTTKEEEDDDDDERFRTRRRYI